MFERQIAFIDTLPDVIQSGIQLAFEQYGFIIKDYIVNKQLFEHGEDGNKVRLQGYTRTTIRIKIAKGQPVDRTTLRDKGFFHANITVTAGQIGFTVESNVEYDSYLRKRYGKAIFAPNVDNMEEFMDLYIMPVIRELLKPYFDGKLAG